MQGFKVLLSFSLLGARKQSYIRIDISYKQVCNKYLSACDWRSVRCQFVSDVTENPGGFKAQLNIQTAVRCRSCNRQHSVHRGLDLTGLS